MEVESTLHITTLCEASEKCPNSRSVLTPEVSLYVYRQMGLCSGHRQSVSFHELSLYQQSVTAKLTVTEVEEEHTWSRIIALQKAEPP